jgi:hypothetical protein
MTHTHIPTNQPLSIKKLYGNIAVCWIEKPYYNGHGVLIDTCIVSVKNLRVNEIQLKLEI